MDGLQVVIGSKCMTEEAARQYAKDGKVCSALVHMQMTASFCLDHLAVLSVSNFPTELMLLVTCRGVGCRYVMRLGKKL